MRTAALDLLNLADRNGLRVNRLLTPLFLSIAILTSAIAFFYPLEIETRESTVWLHVLALRNGVNIYDHAQVAFINQNHGPFDPLFKLWIATIFPFLNPWQVARVSVLLLPYAFLAVAWNVLNSLSQRSVQGAVYLGAVGYLFLVVSAKEFIFVGRSDATAALLLLPLTYLCVTSAPKDSWTSALHGVLWGSLGVFVMLTNWRMLPVVFALFIFNLWLLRYKRKVTFRNIAVYVVACACASAVVFALILFQSFGFDLPLYYKHFFGVYSPSSGHGHRTYGHASGIWFLGSLLRPTASADSLKGSPALWALAVYLLVPGKSLAENRVWLTLGIFVFATCSLAFYLNYYGGGQWYYVPFLIVLWFFLCANYSNISRSRLSGIGIIVLALLCVNASTVITPSLWRVATYPRARQFMSELRSLESKHSMLSEDMFFFRTSYGGELIDMGDMVSRIRKRGDYYGDDFNRTVDKHFERLRRHPPDYVVSGFTESPELRRFTEENYSLVALGPGNFTANGFGEAKLLRRKDLAAPRATAIRQWISPTAGTDNQPRH